MHDLTNSHHSAYEFSVRSIWNSISNDSRANILGHVSGNESGIDYIDAGMDHYPNELDYSAESAYQQDFSRRISSYVNSDFDSLPQTVRDYISETMIKEGFPTDEEENSTTSSSTYCEKCDMEMGTEEDLNVHKNAMHDDIDEEDYDKSEKTYDYLMNGDSDISEEKIIEAKKLLKSLEVSEKDFIAFPREVEEQMDIGSPTKNEPDDVKGKVGMDYNPNSKLYDNITFKKGSAKNRGGVQDLTKTSSLGEAFTGDLVYKSLNTREKNEARFGVFPSRIYDKFNFTEAVENYVTEKAIKAHKALKALEAEKELTCPYCDTKFDDKTELTHHKKDHVESSIPSFLTEPDEDDKDKVFATDDKDEETSADENDRTPINDDVPEFLRDIDFTEDKVDAGEAYVTDQDIDDAIVEDDTPEGYNKEDKVEESSLRDMIVERKLEGHPDYSIIRQVELYSDLSREAAESLVREVYPSDIDYESYSLFNRRYHQLSSEEKSEMKLYGGEAMKEAAESYKRGSDDRR